MRFAWVVPALVIVACGSRGGPTMDAGTPIEGGVCCSRGAPSGGSCSAVAVPIGGFSLGGGGCKQMSIPACHAMHSGADAHGCAIWIDDGPCDCDAGACDPIIDITGFSPIPMQPPHARMSNACSSQQISDFAACNTGDVNACDAADGSPCTACLASKSADASWGPLVDAYWNSGGCVDLVLGQTSIEPSSCGAAYDKLEQCIAYACGQCSILTTPRLSCDDDVVNESCKGFAQATIAPNGPCGPLLDAGAPDVSVCFPDTTIADPTARQRDFVTRIATYFCGP